MKLPDYYLLTVAIHAAALSLGVLLAVYLMKRPQRVSVAALSGLLAVAILPWFSAMRPEPEKAPAELPQAASSDAGSLPQWTVVRIPSPESYLTEADLASPIKVKLIQDIPSLLGAVWILGTALLLINFLFAWIRVQRWRKTLWETDDAAWSSIQRAAGDLPARKHFRLTASSGPCVAGFFRPLIVVPVFLLAPEKQRELEWALRHEVRHWRGGDSRWSVVLELLRAGLWWNPPVHLLISRWKMAREGVCDLSASGDQRADYGNFLIAMSSQPAPRNPLAVTMVRRQRLRALRSRIVTLLEAAPGSGTPFEKGILFTACFALLGAALLISGVKIGGGSTSSAKGAWSGFQEEPFGGVAFAGEEPRQDAPAKVALVKVSTMVVGSSRELAANGAVVTDAERQLILRKLAMEKGSSLMTTPSVCAKVGESARIELIREHPDDPPWKSDAAHTELRQNRFAGWSLRYRTAFDEGKLYLAVDAGFGFVPGAEYHEVPPVFEPGKREHMVDASKINWGKLMRKDGSAWGLLSAGENLVISFGELTPGRFTTVFIEVKPIDRTGRDVVDFESAKFIPPVPLEGRVRLKGTVAPVPENMTLYEVEGRDLLGIGFVVGCEVAEDMRRDLPDAVTLPEVEISTGQFTRPWKEVEGVEISVEILRDSEEGTIDRTLNYRFPNVQGAAPDGLRTNGFRIDPEQIHVMHLQSEAGGVPRLLWIEAEVVE